MLLGHRYARSGGCCRLNGKGESGYSKGALTKCAPFCLFCIFQNAWIPPTLTLHMTHQLYFVFFLFIWVHYTPPFLYYASFYTLFPEVSSYFLFLLFFEQ